MNPLSRWLVHRASDRLRTFSASFGLRQTVKIKPAPGQEERRRRRREFVETRKWEAAQCLATLNGQESMDLDVVESQLGSDPMGSPSTSTRPWILLLNPLRERPKRLLDPAGILVGASVEHDFFEI